MRLSILNKSDGKWAFTDLATMLSKALWIDTSESIGDLNYILCADTNEINSCINSFVSIDAIHAASDKREVEKKFARFNIQRPKTFILNSLEEVEILLRDYQNCSWILKYPIGSGGMHHRIIEDVSQIPSRWQKPFLIQEFIKSIQPRVYRAYCIDKDIFGFNTREFLSAENINPWVSHANGARYVYKEKPDREVIEIAKNSLIATGLYDSFGVVDLIKDINGNWYSLEVGTDGIYNYVDRDIDNNFLLDEINERLAIAFWKKVGNPPWGKSWKYRE